VTSFLEYHPHPGNLDASNQQVEQEEHNTTGITALEGGN
jgi:hypothetical protein